MLALVAAAVSFAAGGIVVRSSPPADPVIRNLIATAVGEPWTAPDSAAVWLGLAYLVGPGTIVVFSLFLYVLGRWSATRVSYQFVLAPIVAILLGAWLLDEPVSVGSVVGAALVIAGVFVGAFDRPAPVTAA